MGSQSRRKAKKEYYGLSKKHLPNKNEGRLLRKLMSQTGMNEEQLREHKKYRRLLSQERVKGTRARNDLFKYYDLYK